MFTYVNGEVHHSSQRYRRCTDENPDTRQSRDSRHIIDASQANNVHVGTALFADRGPTKRKHLALTWTHTQWVQRWTKAKNITWLYLSAKQFCWSNPLPPNIHTSGSLQLDLRVFLVWVLSFSISCLPRQHLCWRTQRMSRSGFFFSFSKRSFHKLIGIQDQYSASCQFGFDLENTTIYYRHYRHSIIHFPVVR